MSWKADIRAAIKRIVQTGMVPTSVEAEVLAVDAEKLTCKVKLRSDGAELPEVQLRGLAGNGLGVVCVPAVGSDVRLGFGDGGLTDAYVAEYGALDSLKVYAGQGLALTVVAGRDGAEVTLGKDDALGGLVKVAELAERLNRLEQRMGTHQHIYLNTLGVPTPTAVDPGTNAPLVQTTVNDLQNPLVKHG